MNETRERPELGTTEAAVRSCVNLIALATHTDEEHLAYWLDLYFQTRARHENAAAEIAAREDNERVLAALLENRRGAPAPSPLAEYDQKDEEILASVDAGSLAAQKKTGLR